MKDAGWKIALSVVLCIILGGLLDLSTKQQELKDRVVAADRDRINDKPEVAIDEPVKVEGKWQIILYHANIIPAKIIKTSCYYIKNKVIWYRDETTGDELPLPEEAMIIPDDGRNLEDYGVYDIEFYNTN